MKNKIIVFDDKKIRRVLHKGEWYFVVKDVTQLLGIIEDIKIKFPDTIKSFNYFFQLEIYKIKYFPEK